MTWLTIAMAVVPTAAMYIYKRWSDDRRLKEVKRLHQVEVDTLRAENNTLREMLKKERGEYERQKAQASPFAGADAANKWVQDKNRNGN